MGDAERFASEVWARRAQRFAGADPTGFADVLSLSDVDDLVCTGGLRLPSLRLVRDGRTLARSGYTTSHTTAGRRVGDAIDPRAVLSQFAEGATIVLQSLHRLVPSVQRFCRDLEAFFGHPVQANAYLTPAGSRGLGVHHDTHDVLVLQLLGTKRWRLYPMRVPYPVSGFPPQKHDDHGEPDQEIELCAGDCLYLPRGVPHAADAPTDTALHLTLGIRSPTWMQVMERVLARARESTSLRAPLPIGYANDPERFARALDDVLASTSAWLREVDREAIVEDELERARRRAPRYGGRLLALADGDPAPDTRFQRAAEVTWSLHVTHDHAVLRAGREALRFPVRIEPALRLLLEADVVRAVDFAEYLDAPGSLVLVRRLHREGLLRKVDD